MAINSNKYVQITSGVGGAAQVSVRELLGRLFTTNELVPTGAVLKFSDADSVRDYFGSGSDEYLRASYYFGFLSVAITQPKNIAFARWANADTSAQVFGAKAGSLAELNLVTAGVIDISLAGVEGSIIVDYSSATSYADAAMELQTKIQALGDTFSASTVEYNALKTQFNLDTNGVADGEIEISGDSATLIVTGWASTAAFSDGVATESVTDVLSNSADLTNDFGSYVFIPELTIAQKVESGAWNITRNNEFQYHTSCLRTEAQEHYDELIGYAGTGVTLRDTKVTDEFHELLPCALLASQDFTSASAVFDYMYVQDSRLTPTVTNTTEAKALDALRINYYGQTQEAGDQINLYQNGILMGGSTAPLQMGVYANEQWLKSHAKAGFLNLLLALPILSADDVGKAQATSVLADTVAVANFNGVISQGKKLNNTQIQYINQISGRTDVHFQVASTGSWYSADIVEEVDGGVTSYVISYTLIYAKRDAVSSITGRHILI